MANELDKYIGSLISEIPKDAFDSVSDEVFFRYSEDSNGRLQLYGTAFRQPSDPINNPSPPDLSLYEPPPADTIRIPAEETVDVAQEVIDGNLVIGGDSSVDPVSGQLRINLAPSQTTTDNGASGRSVNKDAPEENFYDNDDVESGGIPGGVGAGSDGSDTGSPAGLNENTNSITTISNPKDAKGINDSAGVFDADLSEVQIDARPNELNKFSSYSYNIALYMLNSKSYVNLLTKPSSPQEVLDDSLLLMRDGGVGTAPENELEKSLGFFNDFYIDNLELTSIAIGPSKRKQNTNVTDIRFTITEPRGVTLMEKLRDAAKATLVSTKEKPIHAPYLLEIKFKGYDDQGKPMAAPSIPKYVPIKITDIKFEVTSMGTEYKVTAIPFAHQLFGQINSTIPMNIELSASTIGNIFSQGARSFNVEKGETRVTEDEKGEEITTTTPEKLKYGDSYKTLADVLTDYQRKRTKEVIKKSEDGTEEKTVPAASEGYDTYSFKIASEIANSKLNLDAIFDALDTPVATGQKKDDGKANKSQFEAYAASQGGGITLDRNSKTFKINAGTDVTKLLNLVIMHSDYMDKNILENAEKDVTDGKPIKWFKIKPIILSAEGDGKGFDGKDGRYKYHIEYVVEPSVVYYHDFPWAPKSKPKGKGFHKIYDYIFSGKNTEVLDFKLDFKTAFMQIMTAGTGSPFADKSEDNDFTAVVKEQPQSPEGNTINGKDSTTRARAKDLFSSVMSDGVDMINLNLRIVGDPSFIATSDAYWQDKIRKGEQYTDAFMPDGTINYELSMPFVQVNLKTPVDYDATTGLANPNQATNSSFSGIYKVTEVASSFTGGIFQQTLKGLRAPLQPVNGTVARDAVSTAGAERKALTKETGPTPIQSGGRLGEFGGITNTQATVIDLVTRETSIEEVANEFRPGQSREGDRQRIVANAVTIPNQNTNLLNTYNPDIDNVLKSEPEGFQEE